MIVYLHPRGTKAALDTLAAANGLKVSQIYYLTDIAKLALATAVNAYVTFTKDGTRGIPFVIDGGGAVIAINQTVDIPDLPAGSTVVGWTVTSDAAATSVVDIQRATYANFPTFASIAGTAKPTLTAAQKNQNITLAGWGSTALAAGDCLRAIVSSNDIAKRITVMLRTVAT